MTETKPNFVILHGNHGTKAEDAWYTYLYNKLIPYGYQVDLRTHEEIVINSRVEIIRTLKEEINCNENTIIIGHSSGAEACMRYAEVFKVLGLVLVTPYVTHMGNNHEKESGYFDYPWKPNDIRNNAKWIIQFSSSDDPFISYKEQSQVIRRMLRNPDFDYTYYKCVNMHHIGKKYQTVNFIYRILLSKIIDNVLPNNITTNELNDNNETVKVEIEKVNDGDEENLITIKNDDPFFSSWNDNILPVNTDLHLIFE
jgi:predicted alpha/beta hydrolase family esterase